MRLLVDPALRLIKRESTPRAYSEVFFFLSLACNGKLLHSRIRVRDGVTHSRWESIDLPRYFTLGIITNYVTTISYDQFLLDN